MSPGLLASLRRWREPTAIVLAVPEADPLLAAVTAPAQNSAGRAHVTVLYPFARRWRVRRSFIRELRQLVANKPHFAVSFAQLAQFEGAEQVTYLAPEPASGLTALTAALVARWPRWQPYGGRFTEIVPHLSVLSGAPAPPDLRDRIDPWLPLRVVAAELLLVVPGADGWQTLACCPLGASSE